MMPVTQIAAWLIFALSLTNLVTFGLWRHAVGEQDEMVAKVEFSKVKGRLDEAELAAVKNAEALTSLYERNRQIEIEKQEKEDALRKLTTGRPCLAGPAVRVLNAGLRLPETQPDTVSTDAAFATDSDVALWAKDAIAQYDTCRNNIDRIAEFYQ